MPTPFHRVTVGAFRLDYFNQGDDVLVGIYRPNSGQVFAEAYAKLSASGRISVYSHRKNIPADAALVAARLIH